MNPNADLLFAYLRDLIYAPKKAELDLDRLDEDFRELGEGLLFFGEMVQETRDFSMSLSRGDMSGPVPGRQNELAAPLKSLHASLRHMTWQTQQVAQGDYQQRLEFMGEFAEAFNTMTQQLNQRQDALMAEIESGKRKTMALEQSIDLLESLTAAIPQRLLVVPREGGEALFANDAAKRMLEEDGPFTEALWSWVYKQVANCGGGEDVQEVSFEKGGVPVDFSVVCHPIYWRGTSAIALIFTDISDDKRRMKNLENVAYRDNLTHVYSRHYGMQRLEEMLDSKVPFVLCFADIDHLKYINDQFGHAAGDEYICAVADLLREFPGGILARIGGDEFMVLAPGCQQHRAESILSELRARLGEIRGPQGSRFPYSISYGVVDVPATNTQTASSLLELADQRMYAFKRSHKQCAL